MKLLLIDSELQSPRWYSPFLHSALTSTKIGRHDAPLLREFVGSVVASYTDKVRLTSTTLLFASHLVLGQMDKVSGTSRMVNFLGSRPIFFKSCIDKHRRSHSADFCRGAISLFFCCNFALFLPDFFCRSPLPVVHISFVYRCQSGRSFCLAALFASHSSLE